MENNKYKNGKIYKITDIGYNKCYIGSTCQVELCNRFTSHRADYKNYLDGKKNFVTSFYLFNEYGVDNCKIELIEAYPCNNIDELHKQEGYYIKNTECVNKHIAGRGQKEYYRDNIDRIKEYNMGRVEIKKEYMTEYRKENAEAIKKTNKEYHENNFEKIKQIKKVCNKAYYESNKDTVLEKQRQYNKLHSEKNNEKAKEYRLKHSEIVNCACGSKFQAYQKPKHIKTQRHQAYLETLKK